MSDALHAVLEQLFVDEDVVNEARSNPFDTFFTQGIAGSKLDGVVICSLLTTGEQGQALYEAVLGPTASCQEVRQNLLRVVYVKSQQATSTA